MKILPINPKFLIFICCFYRDRLGGKKYTYNTDAARNKLFLITGATSGLGKATAKELAFRKGKVILACRDMPKCEQVGTVPYIYFLFIQDACYSMMYIFQVATQIRLASKNKAVECRQLDLSSQESIRLFVESFNQSMYMIPVVHYRLLPYKLLKISPLRRIQKIGRFN